MASSNIKLNTTSVGMVMDLISEGPIKLKNGLNSVFLNGTPMSNNNNRTKTLDIKGVPAFPNSDGTQIRVQNLLNTYYDQMPYNILIYGGAARSTTTASAGATTITTSTSFFNSAWIGASSASPETTPRIRIVGGNPDGSASRHVLVSVTSATEAEIAPALPVAVTSAQISFDLSTTGIATLGSVYARGNINLQEVNIELGDTIPLSAYYNDLSTGDSSTWSSLEAYIQTSASLSENNVGIGVGNNFQSAKLSFRSGTRNQEPVKLSNFSSGTATVISPGVQLSQVSSVVDENGATINIAGQKNVLWWKDGNPSAANVQPTVASSSTVLNATTGALGFNMSNPSAADSIDLTINFPNGLVAVKQDGSLRSNGVVFQFVFKHKLSGEGTYRRKLILGPSYSKLNSIPSFIARELGFGESGTTVPGLFFAEDDVPGSIDIHLDLKPYQPFDDWQLEISKITPDSFAYDRKDDNVYAWQAYGQTTLSLAQVNIEDKFSYPFSGYATLEFGSNEFQGKTPERRYHCLGVECSVPTNYVTREEAEDGIATYTRNIASGSVTSDYVPWDGTFRRAYTNNPVWCLREMLLNKRWGLGDWMSETEINDYSFYSLARYCDELVPDGEGGLEPRFTCGVYLTQPTEAYKVIKDFCTIMLSIPYWVDGQLILEGDRPAEPVYTFTKSNIIDGIFSYEGTGNRARVNQVAVTYNDKDNFYEQAVELVDDIENIVETNRLNVKEVVAFGATSRSQAIRYGKWKLLTSKLQKEIISFKTAENAAYLKPGSIINVQDADRDRIRYSGRLRQDASGTSIPLDSAVDLTGGYTYQLHVIVPGSATYLLDASATISGTAYVQGDIIAGVTTEEAAEVLKDSVTNEAVNVQFSPDVHLETRTISTTGTTNTLTLSNAFSSDPVKDTVWAITLLDDTLTVSGSPKEYKVLAINEESPGVYGVTAAEHFNSKFDLVDEDYLSEPPDYQPRRTDIPAVTNLTGKNGVVAQGGTINNNSLQLRTIKLSWDTPKDYVDGVTKTNQNYDRFKIVELNGSMEPVFVDGSTTSYTFTEGVATGNYVFGVQAVSSVGPVSELSTVSVSVLDETTIQSTTSSGGMPVGGTFSKPIILDGSSISAPSSYTFTSPSGKETIVGS
jgi:hypothetical protein